jgi:Flp pilus assembly protein TadD
LASSTQSAPLGAQIVRDGQAALAAAQTKFGRSGAYYYIGMGYFWQADYQQGLINENQSLVEDPADQAAIITGSELLINLGRNQEAITLIERALATDTKNSTALRTRSFAYANLGKRAQALTDIDTATSIDQSDPKKAVNLSYDTLDRSLVVGAERPLKFYP